MKSAIRRVKENVFQPFELTIIIESKNELLELYHRLNLSWSDLKNSVSKHSRPLPGDCYYKDTHHSTWKLIDDTLNELDEGTDV